MSVDVNTIAVDDAVLGRALRAAATAGPGAASRPGQLRSRLEAELGPEQALRLRAPLHQVVGAAEEHVPATLSSLAPLSDLKVDRVAADLAAARGWTFPVAHRAAVLWAAALGLLDASAPDSLEAVSDPSRPALAPTPTAAPQDWPVAGGRIEAADDAERPSDEPTDAASPAAGAGEDASHAQAGSGALRPSDPSWPPVPPRLAKHIRAAQLDPPLAAARATRGRLPGRVLVAIVAPLCVGAIVLIAAGGRIGLLPVLLLMGLSRLCQPGVVAVYADHVTFLPLAGLHWKRPSQVTAAWADVTVGPGAFPHLQVGPVRVDLWRSSTPVFRAASARTARLDRS